MASKESQYEYYARCAGGFEPVLAEELRSLHMRRVRPQVGGVSFWGRLGEGYRACLWSRVATRVQMVLTRVGCMDADALYRDVRSFAWEEHVPLGVTIAVDAHGTNAALRNTQFTALKVKDALCDHLRELRGIRPDVDARQPDVAVDVAVHPQKATLYLNLSGASLHRRGYREDGVQTAAPLKETLAAGLLLAAGWPQRAQAGALLVDPMCGSGTIAIEGAMMAAGIAPGLLRGRWGFEGWAGHDEALWARILAKARERACTVEGRLCVVAGDIDPHAVEIARDNMRRAGVAGLVCLFVDDAAHVDRHLRKLGTQSVRTGIVVTNPPYGERLLSADALPRVRATLAQVADACVRLSRSACQTTSVGEHAREAAAWRLALISPDVAIDSALGRTPIQAIDCFNGPLQTWVRVYDLDEATRRTVEVVSLSGRRCEVPVGEQGSAQFAARLRKVARERARWARRAGVSCYRLYDADLPDYAVSVDLFEGVAEPRHALRADMSRDAGGTDEAARRKHGVGMGTQADASGATSPTQVLGGRRPPADDPRRQRYLVIEERRRPGSVDAQRARRRFADAASLAAALLDVPPSNLVLHEWSDSRRHTPHTGGEPCTVWIGDGDALIALDLCAAHDAGVFLSQRCVRELARELAAQVDGHGPVSIAALFARSSAALVSAATAVDRARPVVVDGDADGLGSARRLLDKNRIARASSCCVQCDVRAWVRQEQRAHHAYDLIVCLAPEWVPARGATSTDFELRRDYGELLMGASGLLSRRGILLFAFVEGDCVPDLDELRKRGFVIDNVSGRVVSHDFERARAKPRCYLIRRG